MTDSPDLTREHDELQAMLGKDNQPKRPLPAENGCQILEWREGEVNGVRVRQTGKCYNMATWRGESTEGDVATILWACDKHKSRSAELEIMFTWQRMGEA